jgi:TRAP-type mannitol/chloroaromatic compound transport system permease small subunit
MVMWVMWKLVLVGFETVLVSMQGRCTVSAKCAIVTPIFKDKNRMHKRLICALGYDRTHK